MKLEIVTETATLFSGQVDQVTLSSIRGELCILPDHLPLIAELAPSVVVYSTSDSMQKQPKMVVEAGFVHIEDGLVTLLTSGVQESLPLSEQEKVRSELAELGVKISDGASAEGTIAQFIQRRNYLESLLALPSA